MGEVNSKVGCPLCEIPKRESLLYEDSKVYLVSTKDQKGHKVRVMACLKRHFTHPTDEEQTLANAVLFDYMNGLMHGEDWFIVGSENASIPDHWHRIATDFPLEDEKDPLFAKTSKIHFPLKDLKVLIGVPCLNEEKTLRGVIDEAKKYGDVLVVNDGSSDRSQEIIRELGVQSIIHSKRCGYGDSIGELFAMAKFNNYDVLVTLDADGQHDASEIPRFLRAVVSSNVVVGNRFLADNSVPDYRKVGIKAVSKFSGVGDSQCGFRAYDKKAISVIAEHISERGMGASIEILKLAQGSKLRIAEVPCSISYDKGDHSQNPLSHGLDLVMTFFWWAIWKKPSKTLLPAGLVFLALSVFSGFQTVSLYAQSHYIVQTWALFTIASLICTMIVFNSLVFILVFKNRKIDEK